MENIRDRYTVSPLQYSSVPGKPRGKPSIRGRGHVTPESTRPRYARRDAPDNNTSIADYRGEQLPEYQEEYSDAPRLYPSMESTRDIDELYDYMQVLDSKIESMSAMLKDMHGWLLSMKVNQSMPTGAPVAQNMSAVGRVVKST